MDGCREIVISSYIKHLFINRVRHGLESHESADHGGEDEEDTRQAAGGGGVVVTRVTERGVAQTQGVLLKYDTVVQNCIYS